MKKLFSLLAALALVVTLAACTPETVIEEVIKEVEVIVEVPVEVIVEVPVEVPVEVIVEVEVPVDVIVEVEVEVPAEVQNERFYKPGVYFNNTEMNSEGFYTYAVVIVDAYGQIAGVMFDETVTESEFLTDGDGQLYVFIEGNGVNVPDTYRFIATDAEFSEYPKFSDAITADDLVVGIHAAKIAELTPLTAHESRMVREDAAWMANSELLADRIIADQSTYGITTMTSGAAVTATNVKDLTFTNVDVLMGLVQDILDGEAMLTEDTVLAATPAMGLYAKNESVFTTTERLVSSKGVTYYVGFVATDMYGAIAGVYADTTYAAGEGHGTKWILNEEYVVGSGTTWRSQAEAFGAAVVANQGIVAFDLTNEEGKAAGYAYADGKLNKGEHIYADQIAGATVGVEGMFAVTDAAIATFGSVDLKDGIFVQTDGAMIMYVVVDGGDVRNVYIDQTRSEEQATVLRDGEWVPVYIFEREWLTEAGEEDSAKVLVYMDEDEYIVVSDVTVDIDDLYEAGDDIVLTDEEVAALEAVAGNYTKHILGERYVMASGNSWAPQADAIAAALLADPYGINLTDGTHTDLTGVTIGHVEEFRQMFINALLDSAAQKADATLQAATSSDAVLPDGNYFANLEVNTKGQQYFAFMTVADGEIETLIFDATVASGDDVATKQGLGDAYGLYKKDVRAEWYDQANAYAAAVVANQSDIIDGLEDGFSYELGATDFGTADFTQVDLDSAAVATISTTPFAALTEMLVKEALAGVVAEEAEAVFGLLLPKTTLLVSDEGAVKLNVDFADLEFGWDALSQGEFELDWESADDGILDVDDNLGDEDFELIVDEVEVPTAVAVTFILTFDEYTFTKEVTYTVETLASAELGALNADTTNFKAVTQVEGYAATLATLAPAAGGTFHGWFTSDVAWADNTGSGIYTTSGLDAGTHTMTAVVEYETGKFVTREKTIEVIEIEDAIAAVAAMVKPANILDNGEVTEAAFVLADPSSILGVSTAWVLTEDNEGVASFDGTNLDITRNYVTSKVVLTATVSNTIDSTEEVLEFEFRAVPADNALIASRLSAVLAGADLGLKYVNAASGATIIGDLNAIVTEAGFLPADVVAVTWADNSDNVDTAGDALAILAIAAGTEEEVTITVTVAVDYDGDLEADVEVEKEFTIILFN
jgi:hypothetical protein